MIFWLTVVLVRFVFRTFYRYRVYGNDPIYEGGAIIAPNHVSYLDPPLIGVSWPETTHYLAMAKLFEIPIMRFLFNNLHTHPVEGSVQDIASFKMVSQLLRDGQKVVVFPEGFRSQSGLLQPIRGGIAMLALRTNCPIIPTYIHGTFNIWPPQRKWPKLSGELVCVFGKPIFMDDYTHLPRKQAQEAISKQVHQSMVHLREWYEKGAEGHPP